MRAMLLKKYAKIDAAPLEPSNVANPKPASNELLVRVMACGLCHTDLHIIEGELDPRKLPIVPGHQIAGIVEAAGTGAKRFKKGDRVGITWINSTCGKCRYCKTGRENLCDSAKFTGYTVNGGYAEYATVSEDFTYHLPKGFDFSNAAPLFCAGIVGYRALKLSGLKSGGTLAIYGFGASAHLSVQVARHMGSKVQVFTRSEEHRALALKLGASWAGASEDTPPANSDAAIVFAPVGNLVVTALKNLKKGGRVAIADIYMSPIPRIDYPDLYYEKSITSVTNYTRADAVEFLKLAEKIPIRVEAQSFKLQDANNALQMLKEGKINGSAVLIP
ncbi:MAG: zinc-dependent alcohol dehydrogenase family protein [Candidatus Micrarchaeota archaeon]|nr:zinc-dependent alcohol dehydrogenase family protein [Candidatus Micrarchaeota archaeon]